MSHRMTLVLLLLYTLPPVHGTYQSKGTVGREFIVAILKTYNTDHPGFAIIITSSTAGKATIYNPYLSLNVTQNFHRSLEYSITRDVITSLEGRVDTSKKGILITTDVDVSLTVAKDVSDMLEGFLVLPTSMLSTRYVAASYDTYQYDSYGYRSDFLILSKEDNTVVNIRVTNSSQHNVTLNYLETYLYTSSKDLSGTVIQSDKPVALFSGHEATAVPRDCTEMTYLVEQMLPTLYFDFNFIVPPLPPKSGFVTRVFTSEPITTVIFRNSTSSENVMISETGHFKEILCKTEPLQITADKPVQVILYGTCTRFNGDNIGDSIMATVPSIHQFKPEYHFTVPSVFTDFKHYLIITSQAEDVPGIRINGQPLHSFNYSHNVQHGPKTYKVDIKVILTGVYHIEHVSDKTFGAFLYGFKSSYSYGYMLGMQGSLYLGQKGLTCLNCKDMSHLFLCDTITICSARQVCYVETFTSAEGEVKYSSGCMDFEQCSWVQEDKEKRSSECVHCCSSQLCNMHGCGSESLPAAGQRGPLCYDCAYVSNMDECKTMKLCAQDEVCSVEKYDWGGLYDHYTAKCHSSQCLSHKRSSNPSSTVAKTLRSTPICQDCCSTDLCNDRCNVTSHGSTGPAIVG